MLPRGAALSIAPCTAPRSISPTIEPRGFFWNTGTGSPVAPASLAAPSMRVLEVAELVDEMVLERLLAGEDAPVGERPQRLLRNLARRRHVVEELLVDAVDEALEELPLARRSSRAAASPTSFIAPDLMVSTSTLRQRHQLVDVRELGDDADRSGDRARRRVDLVARRRHVEPARRGDGAHRADDLLVLLGAHGRRDRSLATAPPRRRASRCASTIALIESSLRSSCSWPMTSLLSVMVPVSSTTPIFGPRPEPQPCSPFCSSAEKRK